MRAIRYQAARDYAYEQVPDPEPSDFDALVRVELAGICGTDLHIHNGTFFAQFPVIPGHEMVGTVEAIGSEVTGLTIGDRVVVNGNSSCGKCEFCVQGRTLQCSNLSALGVTGDGGFAELIKAPGAQCIPVGDLPIDIAVLAEPTACATHGVTRINPVPGDRALVLGAGPTGLILAQLLQHSGASNVTVAAPTQFKLDVATNLGLDDVVLIPRTQGEAGTILSDHTPGGFDIVVDATGSPSAAELAVPLTRDGGTAMFYGVTRPEDRIAVSPYDVYRREISIKGSFAQIDSFPAAVAMLANGRVRTDGILTNRFALAEFGDALEALGRGSEILKAVIDPRVA